jgi:putative MFS transporter
MPPSSSSSARTTTHTRAGIEFFNPAAFWIGTTMTVVGVLLHLRDFASAADMGYVMVGMPMTRWMLAGMVLIIGGLILATIGLHPFRVSPKGVVRGTVQEYHFRAMDDARLTPAHWGLLFVLGVALIIDVMKPATLAFVMPGTKAEYGLTTSELALLPLIALTGTTIGSVIWGYLADRIGRRASILLASVMFIGTSICGFMPSYSWNLFMCFVMGLSAGGMLPIVYALMAESVPAHKRGWLVVLHGGMGTVGGYMAASGFAALLEPIFTWRILWFLGLPTGLLMLLLNRWIPESPRYLLERGREDEARAVMARYGIALEQTETPITPESTAQTKKRLGGLIRLFRQPYSARTFTVVMYGLGWGLVNWGFLTFLPTFLSDAGYGRSSASGLLFLSSIISIPGTIVVAWLYGMWSSKRTMILYAALTALTMVGFAFLDPDPTRANPTILTILLVSLFVASGGVISMLSPYTAEVYPTALRGSGSGLAAGSSKLGGILGPPVIASLMAISPGLALPALASAAPIALSAMVLAWLGVETRGRRLEDISSATVPGAPSDPGPGVL